MPFGLVSSRCPILIRSCFRSPTLVPLFSPTPGRTRGFTWVFGRVPCGRPPTDVMWGAFRATRPALDGRVRFTKPLKLSQSAKANRRTVTARMQANAHVIREGKAALAAAAVAAAGARKGAGEGVAAAGAASAGAASSAAAVMAMQAARDTDAVAPTSATGSASTATS